MGNVIRPQLLSDMCLIVKLSKRQSFSLAAKDLNIPTSSFSRRIAAFEVAMGVRLIDRTTRRLSFTAQGLAYVREASRIVEEAEQIFQDFQADTRSVSGEIRVAVPQISVVTQQVSTLIAGFSDHHRDITFHIEAVASPVEALAKDCEIAIVAGIPKEASTIVRKLGDVETGIFASRSYLQRHPRPTRPGDLIGQQLLAVEHSVRSWRLYRGGTTTEIPLDAAATCNCFSVAEDMVAAGNCIALLPRIGDSFRPDAKSDIELLLPEWSSQSIPLYLATSSRLVSARSNLFLDYTLEFFKRSPFRGTAPQAGEPGLQAAS